VFRNDGRYTVHVQQRLEEMDEAFRNLQDRKSLGPDGLNLVLFNYRGMLLERGCLWFVNTCWKKFKIPKPQFEVQPIPVYKKER
jgi:G:T-mismatch repair DNA endonuclease (very short patch repair protein)